MIAGFKSSMLKEGKGFISLSRTSRFNQPKPTYFCWTVERTRPAGTRSLCESEVSSFDMMKQRAGCEQVILSDDAVAALSEEIILLVEFSLVLSDGNIEPLLLKVRLLFLTDGGLLQHLCNTKWITVDDLLV